MAVDFAAVFRVLVTLFGITALLSAAGGVATYLLGGPATLLLLVLVSAMLSLAFRVPARAAGGRSGDRISLVASSVIVIVLGSLVGLLLLFIWAVSGLSE